MRVTENDIKVLETLVPGTAAESTDNLKNSGLSVVTYGIRPGDTIEFFDDYETEGSVVSRSFAGGKEFLVACKRNGELSLFSISDLRRRGADMAGLGQFRKDMLTSCENDAQRLAKIAGMTVKAGDIIKYQSPKEFVPEVDENGEKTGRNVPKKDENGDVIYVERTCPDIVLVNGKKSK